MLRSVLLIALCSLVPLLSGCPAAEDIEGNVPGECSDGADNDSDGYFDCGDSDCFGAPVCNGEGDDDDTTPAGDDDDSTPAGDDDDASDDDDSGGSGDGVTPVITDVTYVYSPADVKFTFTIIAEDPDDNFGIPLLIWSIGGTPQTPINMGSTPLQGDLVFNVEWQTGVTAGETYAILFAVRDDDGNQSDGYFVQAAAN